MVNVNITALLAYGMLIGMFLGVGIVLAVLPPSSPQTIKSETIITPEIELILRDNVVDTLWVYKLQ